MKPETKFYAKIKKNITSISWIRLENLSVPGTPDLLGYNNSGVFFTVELKYTKTNKVTFSPHQIAFHVKHPKHTFILVEDACLKVPKLYEGSSKHLPPWFGALQLGLPLVVTVDVWVQAFGAGPSTRDPDNLMIKLSGTSSALTARIY